jgi:hypothetical protein
MGDPLLFVEHDVSPDTKNLASSGADELPVPVPAAREHGVAGMRYIGPLYRPSSEADSLNYSMYVAQCNRSSLLAILNFLFIDNYLSCHYDQKVFPPYFYAC